MSKKMLIDARHREETRVAVMSGNKVEDFDFESQSRMPLRGNIYLARITRVEPSLQAAFVEYGGNRHGFLAFSEIHPDYYQIPVSDREILRAAEALEAELADKLAELDQMAVDDEDDVEATSDETSETAEEAKEKTEKKAEGRGRGRRRRGRGRGRNRQSTDASENQTEESAQETSEAVAESEASAIEDSASTGNDTPADYVGEDLAEAPDWHGADADLIEVTSPLASEDPTDTGSVTSDDVEVESSIETSGSDDEASVEAVATTDDSSEPAEKSDAPSEDDDQDGSGKTIALSAPNDPVLVQDVEQPLDPESDEPETPVAEDDTSTNEEDVSAEDVSEDEAVAASSSASDDEDEDQSAAEDIFQAFGSPEPTNAEDEADNTVVVAEDEAADVPSESISEDTLEVAAEDQPSEPSEARAKEEEREPTEEELAARAQAAEIAELKARYEDARREREKLLRNYRIQEVIKRRQILLVQVVKEERGNKGAALTTFMSMAGRYGVLMPNNARGGGVSRKITNASDRKRLRKAISELNVPKGQGLIIRTAGAKRTKAEIKRDYDYLARLWDTIREQTLKSVAPCLIYEEASLIKRAIRDLYDKDTDQILVEGETGYREAKDFMKMLMPSHAKNVQPYREVTPLFLRHDVERQLDEMYQPVVTLKSGGYLVIQQTEALISIDVNSGKATKERNVEATALKTNSEAAVEVARQCRLRDLAGLVVIDFIDMEENRNNRAVEKKLKDAMKSDRARIQIGNISGFGLMEMSRQRRRSGIVDGTTRACPTCEGAGTVRSVEMAALRILRAIEEASIKDRAGVVTATTCHEVAIYILNQKRSWLNRIEETYKISVEVLSDHNKAGDQYEISKRGKAPDFDDDKPTPVVEFGGDPEGEAPKSEDEAEAQTDAPSARISDDEEDTDGEGKPKSRRRRRRRRRKNEDDSAETSELKETTDENSEESSSDDGQEAASPASDENVSENKSEEDDDADSAGKRRRRGRRGGRRNRKKLDETTSENAEEASENESDGTTASLTSEADSTTEATQTDVPEAVETSSSEETAPVVEETTGSFDPVADAEPSAPVEVAEQTDVIEPEASVAATKEPDEDETPKWTPAPDTESPKGPKRGGWWQRAFKRD